MTVTSEINRAGPYFGDGAVTVFPFGFRVFDQDHLQVILFETATSVETVLTRGTHYTVAGVGAPSGGSITMLSAPTVGQNITILRRVPFIQDVDLENQGAYYAETIEETLDLAVMRDQQLQEQVSRAVKLPPGMGENTELTSALFGGILRLSESASQIDTVAANISAVDDVADDMASVKAVAENLPSVIGAVPTQYPTRAALAAALPSLPTGQIVTVDDVPYQVDPTATGMSSAMWDIGINGVRAVDRPLNAYIAAFHDHNSPRVIRIYSSADGKAWRLLNTLPLEYDAGVINGGNPVIAYRDGWFYMLVSFTSVGNYDFRIYKTRDFTSFQGPFNCNLGPTPVSSNTNPAPGGSVPANEVWGAEMVFTPTGEMHVFASIPYGPDITDIRGRTIGNRRTYRAKCNNLAALTFDAPQIVLPGGDNWSMIDASATRVPNGWLLNIKDSTKQTIRVYTGTSIEGPWSFQEEVANPSYAIEGSSIVPRRLSTGAVAWDMYAEAHNTIPDWIAAQQIMVYRGGISPAGWGAITPTWLKSTRGIRHGTPLNLGFEDPAAYRAFQRLATVAAGGAVETNEQWNELMSGARSIVPNPGAVYFVTGGTVTNLTILDSVADEFFLAVLSTNPVAGINIIDNGKVLGSVAIGFGVDNNRLVRFIRREDTGRYHAEIGAGRALFAANKNGADQVVPAGATTSITFPNEVLDAGGFFSGNGWTPPAGRYLVQGGVSFTGATTDQTNTLRLLRNGTSVRRVLSRSVAGSNCLTFSAVVTANGTDTFTIDLNAPGSGDKTVSGTPDVTWFEGVPV